MNEWGVVGVIVALLGLGAAVVTPIVKLNTIITKLAVIVESLGKDVSGLTTENTKSHERIWTELGEQGDSIADHETRISIIEHTGKGG